jgi:hypothetical protein
MQCHDDWNMNIFKKFENLAAIISSEDPELMLQRQKVISVNDASSFEARLGRPPHKMGDDRRRPIVDVPFRDIHNSDFSSAHCTHAIC